MSANDLVTIHEHEHDKSIVYLDTPQHLASTMGHFRPARYIGARRGAYVLPVAHVPAFRRFASKAGIDILDSREPVTRREPERPLPECSTCGQPAQRGARLDRCPNCGEVWTPVEP